MHSHKSACICIPNMATNLDTRVMGAMRAYNDAANLADNLNLTRPYTNGVATGSDAAMELWHVGCYQ